MASAEPARAEALPQCTPAGHPPFFKCRGASSSRHAVAALKRLDAEEAAASSVPRVAEKAEVDGWFGSVMRLAEGAKLITSQLHSLHADTQPRGDVSLAAETQPGRAAADEEAVLGLALPSPILSPITPPVDPALARRAVALDRQRVSPVGRLPIDELHHVPAVVTSTPRLDGGDASLRQAAQ